MAQARQELEAYQGAKSACLDGYGVEWQVTPGGEVVVMVHPDENGDPIPGLRELVERALDECGRAVREPSLWTADLDSDAYQRMLDVRSCLIAQGEDIPAAPSEDVWVESGYGAWNPYEALVGPEVPLGEALGQDEIAALMSACPQSGPGGLSVAFGDQEG